MKAPALLTAMAVTVSAVANSLHAQEQTESLGATASWETRAESMLLASDSLALVELRTVANQGIALAELGAQKATSPEVKKLATMIQKEQRTNIAELNEIAADLRQSTEGMGLEKEDVDDPRAIGAVAFYWRDSVPVFRRKAEGVYVADTTAIYRRRAVAVVPFETRLEQFEADTTETGMRHTAAITNLKGLTGDAFDEAFLEAQIELAQWRIDHIHDHIMNLVWNDDLGNVANDMQEGLGIHMRKAIELKSDMS